ncbi:serine/threonine-protein kinase Kin4p [[Candida] railenensis]|uniref:non-specific serine/threonine protein kinase n=1 Tax=[Candida] railenensis TaxID=45579 RepID=A0A9P0W050_9ASCO|nr:serine/threonine-protein kinase Kin4p [[Candida] railenensis]
MSATYVDEARASMPAPNVMMAIPGQVQPPVSNGVGSSSIAKRIHREVRFGNYILGSTLGEGEFGKVKLGWRKDGKQPSQVAIKLIKRDSILKDSDSEIKVHREINSLKLLNHPNIVNLVEVMKSGKYIGIVLEYASGGELFDYILHHKYLKENVAKKLFAQLVSGVDYMHSKGLIHRDLKLENLLLDKHKNVIISDFGFVNSYNRDKNDLMKTSCGSPCYAAPELVLTQSPYEGRKVDIWSLGVILYAMLSGYLPFDDDPENEDGADIVRLYHYICKTPLTFPEYVSPLARDLLRKIIVPDPKKRINMNDIRNHPWLTPHVNLLSIRQPEWDRIYKENRQPPNTVQQNANKRFSMLNERTSSSALMPKHGRSSSNGGINPSSATTSSSLANAIALPSSKSSSTITINYNFNNNTNAGSTSGNGGDSDNSSATPSPTKQFTRGHAKSASMSSSNHQQPQNLIFHQSAASTALKAVVSDSNNFKRNSISSITSLTSSIGGGGAVNGSSTNISNSLSRSSTYNGAISTIVESPTKTYLRNPMDKNNTSASAAAALSAAALAARQQQQQQAKTSIPEGSAFISLLPSRAGYNSTRLPHSEKKPRPTSYHPSSMSSTLISNSNAESVVSGILDYMSPLNLQIPQFLSSSPTKSSPIADSDTSPVPEGNNSNNNNNNSSPTSTGVKLNARRNSAVTPINVNGVLTSENESNKNSVLNYLEDKIDALELTDSHSPSKEQFTPQDKQATVDEAASVPKPKQRPLSQNVESLIPKVLEDFKKEKAKEREREREKEKEKEKEIIENHQPRERKQRVSSIPSSNSTSTLARENKEDKENKKRNRFSILSFYSTYNSSSNNIASHSTETPQVHQQSTKVAAPVVKSPSTKKILEPSSDANIAANSKDKKRIGSSGSSRSTASRKSVNSPSTNSNGGKEASAARKVMDFFKRRSVRIG